MLKACVIYKKLYTHWFPTKGNYDTNVYTTITGVFDCWNHENFLQNWFCIFTHYLPSLHKKTGIWWIAMWCWTDIYVYQLYYAIYLIVWIVLRHMLAGLWLRTDDCDLYIYSVITEIQKFNINSQDKTFIRK